MAKSWTPIDATLVGSFIEHGYGQGTGKGYTPWLDKEKVWARKPVTILKGWTTGRVHYLVGEPARPYFFLVEWSSMVTDIREHYPLLPLEETLAIAKELDIRHPIHGQTRKPAVLVSDFLLTVKRNETCVQQARALSSSTALDNLRNLEVLEIERRYWETRGIDWGVVTEREIPATFVRNVDILHGHMVNDPFSYLSERDRPLLVTIMERLTCLVQKNTDWPLNHLTSVCDKELGCEPGTALAITYSLLATRQWQIDMETPINPQQPLILVKIAS